MLVCGVLVLIVVTGCGMYATNAMPIPVCFAAMAGEDMHKFWGGGEEGVDDCN